MGHDLAVIGALYSVREYGDYSALVSLFEKSPMLVIGDEDAFKHIIELVKQSPKAKRSSTLKTPDKLRELDFFAAKVFAYHYLGRPLYDKEQDEENISCEAPANSAVDCVCRWGKIRGSSIGYNKLVNKIDGVKRKGLKDRNWITIQFLMYELYRDDKGSFDLSKGKLNAKGTYFDPIVYSEFWEELEKQSYS